VTPEQRMIRDFQVLLGQPVQDTPGLIEAEDAGLRIALIAEEFNELIAAIANEDIVAIADALGDLKYVVEGAANGYGIDLEPVFLEIHRSNLEKLGPDGFVVRREDGKILKPEGWKPPDLKTVIEKQKESVRDRERKDNWFDYESVGQGVPAGTDHNPTDGEGTV